MAAFSVQLGIHLSAMEFCRKGILNKEDTPKFVISILEMAETSLEPKYPDRTFRAVDVACHGRRGSLFKVSRH